MNASWDLRRTYGSACNPQATDVHLFALVEAEREGGHDRRAIGARMALEGFVEMLEAAAGRDAMSRKQRKLRGPVHQRFQRIEAIIGRDLANGIHPGVNIERGQTSCASGEFSETFADLVPYWPELVASHYLSPVEATVASKG